MPHFVAVRDLERYYYSFLLQYMPYRNESEILEGFNNAHKAFPARDQSQKQQTELIFLYVINCFKIF